MALQGLIFILGIIVAVFGASKRKSMRGKWLIAAGLLIMFVAVVLMGYTDLKSGFIDALND